MLVLTRLPAARTDDPGAGSDIVLVRGQERIVVRLVDSARCKSRIGVEAGLEWSIWRGEILAADEAIQRKEP